MQQNQLKLQSKSLFIISRTIVGVKCKDGVILGAEKLVFSKLLVEKTNKRIFNVDKNIGMAIAGKIPDGRHLMTHARNESSKFLKDFGVPIPGRTLCDRLSLYLNAFTLYNAVRPFGSAEIVASYNKTDGFGLYMLDVSGNYYGYSACTAGKGRQVAKAQFEKYDFSKLTCEEALFYVSKM
jgi:20S proteasome subunit alpha 7